MCILRNIQIRCFITSYIQKNNLIKISSMVKKLKNLTLRSPRSGPCLKLGGAVWAGPPLRTSLTHSPFVAPSGTTLPNEGESSKPPGRNGRLLMLPLTKSFGGPTMRGRAPESSAPIVSSDTSL